jgi:hypothetical protein
MRATRPLGLPGTAGSPRRTPFKKITADRVEGQVKAKGWMMATAAVPTRTARSPAVPAATRRPGLTETLRSELTKIASVRSTYWTLLAQAAASIGWAVLDCAGTAAKAMVLAAVTFTISLAASFTAFFTGQAILASKHINATLAQPGVLRAVLLSAAVVTVFGLLAYGTGAIVRHTAGAITAILGVIFLTPLLTQALPTPWYQDIVRWLPGGQALSPIFSSAPAPGPDLFSAWGEFGVFCGYAVVLLAAGAWLFSRRDA